MEKLAPSVSYVEPPLVGDDADCYFYHRMELPELGEVGGDWDLRGCVDAYLGGIDYSGKRVLDVGSASGYLTFSMEERGANVVSFDMDSGARWDLVPQPGRTEEEEAEFRRSVLAGQQRLRSGYWKAHRLLGSRARAFYGDIYDLPKALGPFDVVFMGMIISHLQDPFQAIYSASRLCSDTLIITNQLAKADAPVARFLPSAGNERVRIWWAPSLKCLEQMLGLVGFELVDSIELEAARLTQDGEPSGRSCTSVIARRS